MNSINNLNNLNNFKLNNSNETKISNFFFEMGQLKRVKRSGWWLAGINNPESVADHSFRASVIAYVLADMEKVNPEKSAVMALFHDLQEARINDLHKVGHKYIDFRKAEVSVIRDQLMGFSSGEKMLNLFNDFNNDKTKEGIVARDADLLECAFQAKEYLHLGYKDTQNWLDNTEKLLVTDSAKKLFVKMNSMSPSEWYKNLKKVER